MVYEIERDSNGEKKTRSTYGQKIKLSDYKIKESIIFVHISTQIYFDIENKTTTTTKDDNYGDG